MNGYEDVAYNGMNGLGGIMLSQITQSMTNTVKYHLHVQSKKYKN